MIKVVDTKLNNGEVWLKVELGRNTDSLVKKLYTENDLEEARLEGVESFTKHQIQHWLRNRLNDT